VPVVAAVVAVVLAVFLSAVFLGLFAGGGSAGSGGGVGQPTFSSARSLADRFATAHGNWSLVAAVGLALANASVLPYNGSSGNASCIPITLVGKVPTNVSLPAFRGSLESGEAPVWLFAYVELGVGGELAVFEIDGEITLAVELPASCSSGVSEYLGFSAPVIDSPAAVAAAAAAGGADFLRAHPTGVSLLMDLTGAYALPGEPPTPPIWEISWSTCSNELFGTGPTSGAEFFAAVYATNGTVVPSGTLNMTCGSNVTTPSSGIGGAISFGVPTLEVGSGTGGTIASQGCTSGDYCYAVPIESASENITPADFGLSLENDTNGSPVTTAAGFAIVNARGTVLVYSVGAKETEWNSTLAGSSQTLLSAGMEIIVDAGPSLQGAENLGLTLTGEGPFANSSYEFGL